MSNQLKYSRKFLFPCEYATVHFLPRLRSYVAVKLYEEGYNQEEIATKLYISKPVVHSYLKRHGLGHKESKRRIEDVQEWIANIGDELLPIIKSRESNYLTQIKKICQECRLSRMSGPICTSHKQVVDFKIGDACSACLQQVGETEQISFLLDELNSSILDLISNPGFFRLVPQVGSQIAARLADTGIAGFPGRLIKVNKEVKTLAYPEFRHAGTLTDILNIVRGTNDNINIVFSIRNATEIQNILQSTDKEFTFIHTVSGDKDWNKALESFDFNGVNAIEDSGGHGYEPIIYILGTDLGEVISILNFLAGNLVVSD